MRTVVTGSLSSPEIDGATIRHEHAVTAPNDNSHIRAQFAVVTMLQDTLVRCPAVSLVVYAAGAVGTGGDTPMSSS